MKLSKGNYFSKLARRIQIINFSTRGIVAERPSSALFVTDTTGSSAVRQTYRKAHKLLKSDEILAQRSAIPVVSTHKRSSRSKTSDGIIEPRSKRHKSDYVSPSERERLRKRAYGGSSGIEDIDTFTVPLEDIWADSQSDQNSATEIQTFIEKTKPTRAPDTLSHPPISLLATSKALPSIPKPKPAHSYNPAFEDWDTLLRAEGDKEVAAEQARIAAEAAEIEAQARIEAAAAEPEQDPLLLEDEEESAWEGFVSGYEETEDEVNSSMKKQSERKTKAQRNKIQRRKQEEREKKHRGEMKRREQQASRIKEIAAEFKAKDAMPSNAVGQPIAEEEGQETSVAEEDDSSLRRRSRLGRRALPPQDLELVLPDELQDSLRLLKPEGNALRNRFRNLQVRGRIEVRKPVHQAKKPRRSTTERWSYKDFTIVA